MKASSSPPSFRTMLRRLNTVPKISFASSAARRSAAVAAGDKAGEEDATAALNAADKADDEKTEKEETEDERIEREIAEMEAKEREEEEREKAYQEKKRTEKEAAAKKEAEERAAREAEEKAKADREANKKAKEAAKNAVKKNKRVLKASVKDANYFAGDSPSPAQIDAVLGDVELVQGKIDADEIAALSGRLAGLKVADEIKAVWSDEVKRLVAAGKLKDGDAKSLA